MTDTTKPGLPTVAQVQAHERNGGRWRWNAPGKMPCFYLLGVLEGEVWVSWQMDGTPCIRLSAMEQGTLTPCDQPGNPLHLVEERDDAVARAEAAEREREQAREQGAQEAVAGIVAWLHMLADVLPLDDLGLEQYARRKATMRDESVFVDILKDGYRVVVIDCQGDTGPALIATAECSDLGCLARGPLAERRGTRAVDVTAVASTAIDLARHAGWRSGRCPDHWSRR